MRGNQLTNVRVTVLEKKALKENIHCNLIDKDKEIKDPFWMIL
jgi:hypothetical protein